MNFPTEKNIQNSKLLILNNISSNRRCLVQQIKNVRNKQKHYQLKAKINIAVHKKDSNSTTQQLKSTIRSVPTLQLKALLHSEDEKSLLKTFISSDRGSLRDDALLYIAAAPLFQILSLYMYRKWWTQG